MTAKFRLTPHAFVTLGLLTLIVSPGLIQTVAELGRSERPQVLEVFDHPPTSENLHSFEHSLENASLVVRWARPVMQYAQFKLLADAGEKAIAGRKGWLFYRPSVRYASRRPMTRSQEPEWSRPLAAIRTFRDRLAARGIQLLVVPVPNKESVYPDRLSSRADGTDGLVCGETRALLDRLKAEGIEVVDLFEVYRRARQEQSPSNSNQLYLTHDSHWTPEGMQCAVEAVAGRLLELGWCDSGRVDYDARPQPIERLGDVLQMLHIPRLEREIGPDSTACQQVLGHDTGKRYRDEPGSRILVLGDSFLRIYERDEPRSAGFIAHLARALEQPVTAIINDGGASTLVRQELYRRPPLLENKTLVIWEFVERDIRDGAEGWQDVPLPEKIAVPR